MGRRILGRQVVLRKYEVMPLRQFLRVLLYLSCDLVDEIGVRWQHFGYVVQNGGLAPGIDGDVSAGFVAHARYHLLPIGATTPPGRDRTRQTMTAAADVAEFLLTGLIGQVAK